MRFDHARDGGANALDRILPKQDHTKGRQREGGPGGESPAAGDEAEPAQSRAPEGEAAEEPSG